MGVSRFPGKRIINQRGFFDILIRRILFHCSEFLSPGAKAEINIDGKTMEKTKQAMKTPSRFTYEVAAEHVYTLLLKKDCYPRFVRSEHYKQLKENSLNPLNKVKR